MGAWPGSGRRVVISQVHRACPGVIAALALAQVRTYVPSLLPAAAAIITELILLARLVLRLSQAHTIPIRAHPSDPVCECEVCCAHHDRGLLTELQHSTPISYSCVAGPSSPGVLGQQPSLIYPVCMVRGSSYVLSSRSHGKPLGFKLGSTNSPGCSLFSAAVPARLHIPLCRSSSRAEAGGMQETNAAAVIRSRLEQQAVVPPTMPLLSIGLARDAACPLCTAARRASYSVRSAAAGSVTPGGCARCAACPARTDDSRGRLAWTTLMEDGRWWQKAEAAGVVRGRAARVACVRHVEGAEAGGRRCGVGARVVCDVHRPSGRVGRAVRAWGQCPGPGLAALWFAGI